MNGDGELKPIAVFGRQPSCLASGFSLSSMSGIRNADLIQLARELEEGGFEGIDVPEATNDALLDCYGIAAATKRVNIGTWIVNIYLRDPLLCAAATATVQEAANGRFILGLGVSHRPGARSAGYRDGQRPRSGCAAIRRLFVKP